jgi:L-ribulose-5-phosphate 3-epimerase
MNTDAWVALGIYEKSFPLAMSWRERLETAARAGFDFVEISIDETDERLERLNWDRAERTRLCSTAAEVGIATTTMCLSAHRKYPMGSQSDPIRRKGLELMARAIAFARTAGVRIVLVPGYDVFYEPSSEATRANFLNGLEYGLKLASMAGVVLALENTDHSITSVKQTMTYVRHFDSPWLQLYCDIGNLNAFGHDVLDELEAGRGHIAGVHVKDTLPGKFRGVAFGDGTVPFVPAFRKLREVGFRGPVMLEMGMDETRDALTAVSRAREWVQQRIDLSLLPETTGATGEQGRTGQG